MSKEISQQLAGWPKKKKTKTPQHLSAAARQAKHSTELAQVLAKKLRLSQTLQHQKCQKSHTERENN